MLLFVPNKCDLQSDLWQYVEHNNTLQQAHITVLLIMQLTAKYQLNFQDVIHMNITNWTVVVLCHTEHAMHDLLQWITLNIQPVLNIFRWIKSHTFCNMNSYSLIEQYVTSKSWFFSSSNLSFLETNSKWCEKYVKQYYFNKMYNVACFLMKMIIEVFVTVKYRTHNYFHVNSFCYVTQNSVSNCCSG